MSLVKNRVVTYREKRKCWSKELSLRILKTEVKELRVRKELDKFRLTVPGSERVRVLVTGLGRDYFSCH